MLARLLFLKIVRLFAPKRIALLSLFFVSINAFSNDPILCVANAQTPNLSDEIHSDETSSKPASPFYRLDESDAETSENSPKAQNSANSANAENSPIVEEPQDVQDAENGDGDERFLSRLRPFKRARTQGLFGGRFLDGDDAPTPPEVEKLEPRASEAPLLTRENPNLPPLDLDGRLGETGTFATRAELDALRNETRSLAWSKGDLRVVPYGFVNLSVSSDTQRAVPGEFILYAQSKDVDDSADFTVDARTSRLGFKIDAPRIDELSADLRGCFEFDFQGTANGSKNKGGVQLRRAYAELVDAENERRLLAGQDWEIISPLAPQMLNYLPAGFSGNLQYRRPQLRFDQGATLGPNLRLLGQIAICDDVLCDYASTSGVAPASAGWPVVESRVAVSFLEGARDGLPITIGVSGHIGEQQYKFSPIAGTIAATSERVAIKTWSTNFDVDVPLVKTQRLQGEYFIGSNLSSFCGGVNQGVDLYRRAAVDAAGGWIALHSDWTDQFATNVGYGIDKPDQNDLVGTNVASNGFATARLSNELYFINCIYNWSPQLMTGVEFSYWNTQYRKADVSGPVPVFYAMRPGESVRSEFTVRFSF